MLSLEITFLLQNLLNIISEVPQKDLEMYVSKYSSIDLSGTKNLHKLAALPAHFLISQPQRTKTFFPGLFKNQELIPVAKQCIIQYETGKNCLFFKVIVCFKG